MSEPWTAAWEEAEATNPPSVVIYHTLELIHPAFTDISGPFSVRCVNGIAESINLTLEPGAPLNGGESVEFKPIPFEDELPEFAEGQTPTCKVSVDSVDDEIIPYLEDATTVRADMTAIYRQYRSDDVSEPCFGPITLTVKKITMRGSRLEGQAQLKNLSNFKFPNKVFTYDEFPGLANG